MKRSMSRWPWIFLSILISTLIYFTIRYGLRPRAIPVMNASSFNRPEEIGAVVYRVLRQDIRAERTIVFGSDPNLTEYANVWTGFLETALADQLKIDVLFARENLSPLNISGIPQVTPFPNGPTDDLFEKVKAAQAAGHLVAIHGSTFDVSHLIKDSLTRRLESVLKHPVLSLSTLKVEAAPDHDLQVKCLGGTSRIECAQLRIARTLEKKRLDPAKTWAVVERHGLKEYLIFVRR